MCGTASGPRISNSPIGCLKGTDSTDSRHGGVIASVGRTRTHVGSAKVGDRGGVRPFADRGCRGVFGRLWAFAESRGLDRGRGFAEFHSDRGDVSQ